MVRWNVRGKANLPKYPKKKRKNWRVWSKPSYKDGRVLWYNNMTCPVCGRRIKARHRGIRSAETGLSYCSHRHASQHVNELYKQGKRW